MLQPKSDLLIVQLLTQFSIIKKKEGEDDFRKEFYDSASVYL